MEKTVTQPRKLRSFSEKIQSLEEQIQLTKGRYEKILQKRQKEIGQIAVEAGLADIDNARLKLEFQMLGKKLKHVVSNQTAQKITQKGIYNGKTTDNA